MAVESDDPKKEQHKDLYRNGPVRPERLYQSVGWSDNQSLPVQQQSAQRAFEQNSEILQRRAAEDKTPENPSPSPEPSDLTANRTNDRPRDYHSLRVETAKAATRDDRDDQKLSFIRDRNGKSRDEPSHDNPEKLSFLRDRSPDDKSRFR